MARKPEEVEAAIELARAAGVSEALLERMGCYTGCVGVLDTGRPALSHACGHDGHTAVGLGVAQWLADDKETLCGKVKLVF